MELAKLVPTITWHAKQAVHQPDASGDSPEP